MALIKCPECRKKISDTQEKCPQCGFDLKDANKEELKIKSINFKMDKKKIVIISIILVVAIGLFSLYSVMYASKGLANKTVKYLENEGYSCKKEYGIGFGEKGEYVCKDKNSDGSKITYTIHYYGGPIEFVENVYNSDSLKGIDNLAIYVEYELENDVLMKIYLKELGVHYGFAFQDPNENWDTVCLYMVEDCDDMGCDLQIGDGDLVPYKQLCDNEYEGYTSKVNNLAEELQELAEELDFDYKEVK